MMDRGVLLHDELQVCPYLVDQVARMPLYRQMKPLTLAEADVRFAMAERRVGWALYKTECPECSACQGLRVLVGDFKMSKSQRRVWNRWLKLGDRLRITMGPVSWSQEKLDLYNRHKLGRDLVASGDGVLEAPGYVGWLVRSCFQTMEMCYYLDEELIGVGVLDLGSEGASSVYFYFEPSQEVSQLSPGVFSVLQEIAFCRRTGRKFHYLGLYAKDCDRLNYKAKYYPHERHIDGKWTIVTQNK